MRIYRFFITLLLLAPVLAQAQGAAFDTCNNFGHFDLFIDVDPPASDGSAFAIDNAGDFPVEAGTGRTIVPADFGDFPGGPHKTDDPGWVVSAGDMLGGEILWFRALGSLRFWDKDLQQWLDNPPNGEQVRFFGAIPPDVIIGGTPAENAFYAGGTIWSGSGVSGPLEAPIEQAVTVAIGDAIHAHLDFCVEDPTGDCTIGAIGNTGSPSIGAYLIEIQLFSDAVASNGVQQKYIDSPPIKVLLNNGLVASECSAAVAALVVPESVVDDSPALPAAGVLIMSGP